MPQPNDQQPNTCKTCRWWHGTLAQKHISGAAICRRMPPSVFGNAGNTNQDGFPVRVETYAEVQWPTTQHYDWCGEHEPIQEGEPDAA